MNEDIDSTLGETNFNLAPLLRHFEDKRRYPRVDVCTDVMVTTADQQVLKTRMRNLSAEGMQIRCDPETARKLHPQGTQIATGKEPRVTVRFELETAGGPAEFTSGAQLRYIAAKNPSVIAFGLKFTGVSLDMKKRLSGYLIDCMRPAT